MKRTPIVTASTIAACSLSVHAPARADDASLPWAAASSSIDAPVAAFEDRDAALERRCGRPDSRLRTIAAWLAARRERDEAPIDAEALAALQRRVGEPHPWARAWIARVRNGNARAGHASFDAWLRESPTMGERRCGVASRTLSDGARVTAAVTVDALADLAPVPMRARTGQWLSLDARLLVPNAGVRVVVAGAHGAPHAVPSDVQAGHVHASFAPEGPGRVQVQVVATVAGGPRPVLEATVFADVPPSDDDRDAGGAAPPLLADDEAILARGAATLREAAHLPALVRSARLDAIAEAHAVRMRDTGVVAHDAGDGDAALRVERAGLRVAVVGENVALAASAAAAHRALAASPSHRENLLGDYDAFGIGVVRDGPGRVWVTEVFARGLR